MSFKGTKRTWPGNSSHLTSPQLPAVWKSAHGQALQCSLSL